MASIRITRDMGLSVLPTKSETHYNRQVVNQFSRLFMRMMRRGGGEDTNGPAVSIVMLSVNVNHFTESEVRVTMATANI